MTDQAKPSITVTQKAAEAILRIRTEEKIPDTQALRMGVRGGGCSGFTYHLGFEEPQDTDERFDQHGVTVVVDPMSLQYLAGTELDFVDGLNGTGFKFNNPNVSGSCGCGSSFTTK